MTWLTGWLDGQLWWHQVRGHPITAWHYQGVLVCRRCLTVWED